MKLKGQRCRMRVAISENSSTTCGTMARHSCKGLPLCKKHFRMASDAVRYTGFKKVTGAVVRRAHQDYERRQRKRGVSAKMSCASPPPISPLWRKLRKEEP